jgi:hypothetical protein
MRTILVVVAYLSMFSIALAAQYSVEYGNGQGDTSFFKYDDSTHTLIVGAVATVTPTATPTATP